CVLVSPACCAGLDPALVGGAAGAAVRAVLGGAGADRPAVVPHLRGPDGGRAPDDRYAPLRLVPAAAARLRLCARGCPLRRRGAGSAPRAEVQGPTWPGRPAGGPARRGWHCGAADGPARSAGAGAAASAPATGARVQPGLAARPAAPGGA